jgi:hypothetical protein
MAACWPTSGSAATLVAVDMPNTSHGRAVRTGAVTTDNGSERPASGRASSYGRVRKLGEPRPIGPTKGFGRHASEGLGPYRTGIGQTETHASRALAQGIPKTL